MIDDMIYDTLKIISLIVAPVIVFLSTFMNIWNIPHAVEITATLSALDILLGTITTALKKIHDNNLKDEEDGYK